jgi:GcrA cell cycle regulator
VIGKVHRLGLSGRATTSRMKSHRPRTRSATATAKRVVKSRFATIGNPAIRALYQLDAVPLPVVEELVIPLNERKTIQTLLECSCRWPIGDPQAADFHFCGKNKVAGLPYCEFHARRAFQPPQVRRRERDLAVAVMTAAATEPPTARAEPLEPAAQASESMDA